MYKKGYIMDTSNTRAVILAAGKSTRFKWKRSKILTHICGQPMIMFPLMRLKELNLPVTLVLGHQREVIEKEFEKRGISDVTYAYQNEQLGTGHAFACSRDAWDKENILVINGDVPLLSSARVKELLDKHQEKKADVSFFTTYMIKPDGYGRVIEKDGIISIVEEKDCTSEMLEVTKVNAGVYVFSRKFLNETIDKLSRNNASGEYYLPDLVNFAAEKGCRVEMIAAPFDEVRGVNTLQELWAVEQVTRSMLIKEWMLKGVRFELAQSIHIDIDVEIGEGSFIGTGAHLLQNTKIGENCFISAFTIIENTTINDGTTIHSHSVVQDSTIGKNVHVGPFARLRNDVTVEDSAVVGNFIEVKNSVIGAESKVKHFSYVGDASLGKRVNVGAGTIVCNYDGVNKHQTVIKDNVFIGSNSTLVAPVTINDKAYIAAGSTINKDVHSDDLAIARARQVNKPGYAKKLRGQETIEQMQNRSEKKIEVSRADDDFQFVGAVKTERGSEENL
jgi:bifunctional UDP-N-acetylglucosamine pyrophosphorylase / glucosamine-1-phosphate N-acetyltransferase